MDKKNLPPITPFDNMVTSTELQMLKLFLPYTPRNMQQFLAVFVKFLELQETIRFFGQVNSHTAQSTFHKSVSSPIDMLDDMKPYMKEKDCETIDALLNMMNMMEMVSAFQTMNQTSGGAASDGFDPMDLVKGMFTPEQQEMFEMYHTMFSNDMDSTQQHDDFRKGNDDDGELDESPGDEKYRPGQTGTD